MPRALAISLMAGLAAALGCAGGALRGPVAADRVQLDVPYYADDSHRAGPSTLASVLTYWDSPTEPKDLGRELSLERFKGAMPVDLLLAAHQRGMQARSFQATVQDVRNELKLGHPVLAYLRLGSALWSSPRFVVITGFDDDRGGFSVHADQGSRFVPYGAFMSKWQKTGRWAILVLPAGEPTMSDRSARNL
jgi:ABC-type bacteriocin/lantibiotic exporter with double-glycine peptidase domain